MVKKAIDSRIPALIRNGAQEKKRSLFVVVGDRQKDVIINLYHILLNIDIKLNKNVLWAYKSQLLGFTSHRKKREKKIKKEIKRGIREADVEDPFELFLSTQNIRYVYYKETEKILGNTYGICILQDFEAITPNLLARTIETVEGGGLVILLLKGMTSLKQLYTLSMDAHSRYRTEAHSDVTARFNERFILSLGGCESCLVVDDELNVLPVSGGKSVRPLPIIGDQDQQQPENAQELQSLKETYSEKEPVGSLIKLAKTVDQAKALLTFVDAISEKTLQSTVALTAARGRGKSAALGVAIAAAIAHGYSNIFITSPSPENLKTLFEFILKGFDALDYLDHVDYDIMQSTNPDFSKAIVRINVHRQHRQTIQYIQPQDHFTLSQAELLVVDEAAAIPLPLVRKLMGPYLVFLSSTVNGYEGTGRALSLKLISQLREQNQKLKTVTENGDNDQNTTLKTATRILREINLIEPIRYSMGDGIEKWMNNLLCLDATTSMRSSLLGLADPSQCELLAVNRDTLFSFHKVSEAFLHSMISLYVASHYKNSPNDLQLMSDAPAHLLYVLIPPTSPDSNRLPEPICVIQVALEGQISRQSVQSSLARGQRAAGDLIPWTISQQFQDDKFAGLSGARIVRIATNPDYIGMGYGRRAIKLLLDFYSGKFLSLSEDDVQTNMQEMVRVTDEDLATSALHTDNVRVRDIKSMPPLFSRLSEISPPQKLDYVGVSYGLTQQLLKFWKREQFIPVYLRQTPNDLTGEHTCIMLRTLSHDDQPREKDLWLSAFSRDFHHRFLSLLDCSFRSFTAVLSLSIEDAACAAFRPGRNKYLDSTTNTQPLTKPIIEQYFTSYDLRRLESYAANMLDYHAIWDLLRRLAMLYFTQGLRDAVKLSHIQSALLLATGLQRRDINDLSKEFGLAGPQQLLAMFIKLIRKCTTAFRSVLEGVAASDLPPEDAAALNGDAGVDEDAAAAYGLEDTQLGDLEGYQALRGPDLDDESGDEEEKAEKERKKALIDALPLEKYAIRGDGHDREWRDAEKLIKQKSVNHRGDKRDGPVQVSVKKRKIK